MLNYVRSKTYSWQIQYLTLSSSSGFTHCETASSVEEIQNIIDSSMKVYTYFKGVSNAKKSTEIFLQCKAPLLGKSQISQFIV